MIDQLQEIRVPPLARHGVGAPVNSSSESGAETIVNNIRDVWRAEGYDDVEVWVKETPGSKNRPIRREIRSNLVAGLPPPARGSRQ